MGSSRISKVVSASKIAYFKEYKRRKSMTYDWKSIDDL